ncbi:MAG: hypothetical protein BWY94_02539 [Actinobacteria bacterium ADurb.BinA094]|nr:MAG: hypothetical protein BWY94_02539 [Actinobacteria bacterium ADurb.BinA094]
MTRCALCHCHHDNTTVCDDCACAVAADIDSDAEGVGNGVAETLRAVLRRAGCDVAVTRIDEVRAARAAPDVAVVPWDRDYAPGEVTT